MGLKDIFRRKPAKSGGKKPSPEPDQPVRQRQDATVMIPAPLLEADDSAVDAEAEPTHEPAADAATVMMQSPITDNRTADDTTERLVPSPIEPSDSAATVAVSIPNFESDVPNAPPAASDAAATVAVSIPGFESDVPSAPPAADVAATVAVSIPDFESDVPNAPPAADVAATVAVSIPDFESDVLSAPPAGDVAATVAVSIPDFESDVPSAPPAADVAATVAVSIPDFESDVPSAPPAGDVAATVAVSIPDFESDAPSAPPAADVAADPLAETEPPIEESARDATHFDLPDAGSERRPIHGVLVAIDGELAGIVCPIHDGETKFGRSEDCDVVLTSMKISREHTTIVHHEGVFAILPLSDKNPTYVNDEVIAGCELSDGDSVRIGRTAFRFRTVEAL